jgi:hypothetical protein
LINQEYFNRHLAGGHTHLYTIESIEHFCKEFDFKIVGKWFFGMNLMDLYRFNFLKMNEDSSSEQVASLFLDKFLPLIDELQLILDRAEFSSEVHLLLKQ